MKALEHLGQSFLIPCQPPNAAHPAEIPLTHPAPGQQHKLTFGRRQRDVRQVDSLRGRRLAWGSTGVALIDKSQRHRLARCLLDRFRQLRNVIAVRGIGPGDVQGQQLPQGIDRQLNLRALSAFLGRTTKKA